MPKINHLGVRTWIEVDTEKLRQNIAAFREIIGPKCRLMAVAKSNAYGHGLVDYCKAIVTINRKLGARPEPETPRGVDWFGVDWIGTDSITEALKLRKEKIKIPILVLGYTLPERLMDALAGNISITVSTLELLKEIGRLHPKKKFKVHLKIDTGMHRQGFLPEQIDDLFLALKDLPQIEVEGVYTHFADAKTKRGRKYTLNQIKIFNEAVAKLQTRYPKLIKHASATAGTLNYPEAHYDMVRIGIGLMGIAPEAWNMKHETKLEPILSWRTIISEIKSLPKGSYIGYGLTTRLKRDSKIAILPVGYWQGYPRSLSNRGQVLVRGRRCKVLGLVAMDMTAIDVTNVLDIKVGDVATLIGKDRDEEITTLELAALANTYHYEFLTRLNPLIKKIYV